MRLLFYLILREQTQGKLGVSLLNCVELHLPDRTVCEDDRIFLGVFEDYFAPGVKPDPGVVLTLHPEVHRLNLLRVDHCNSNIRVFPTFY